MGEGAISTHRMNSSCHPSTPFQKKKANPPDILNTLPQNHPLIHLKNTPIPCCPPPPGLPSSPESFLDGVLFNPFALLFNPFAVGLSPFNMPLMALTGILPGGSSKSGSGRPLDMIPPPPGEEALLFLFPLGPGERGLVWVQALGWRGNAECNPKHNTRDSTHPQHPTYTPESTSQVH